MAPQSYWNTVIPALSERATIVTYDRPGVGMKLQQRLVNLIPGGKHVIAKGVGHNIHVEKPETLIDLVIEMIDKIQNSDF